MIPDDLVFLIAEQSPAAWRALAAAIPVVGRETLRPRVQSRLKDRWSRVRTCEEGSLIKFEWILPSGAIHGPGDEPAVVLVDGRKWWYKNDKKHRDGDKPAVVFPGGSPRQASRE